jgi:hypothetical protein
LDRVEPISPLQTGDILTLKIDPHKGKRKQFQLTAQVLNYVPDRLVSLKITQDSSGRLTQLFDEVEWKIEIMPQSQDASRSIIEGTVTAHTRHWRARFFGRIAEKILMNQIFYPNLIQLSEMRQPFSVDPAPHMPPTL